MIVFKRDGRKVQFDKNKIKEAVLNAFEETDGERSKSAVKIADNIADHVVSLNKDLSVEEIQDIVEEKLMESNRKDVAKAYILYRDKRTRRREIRSEMMSIVREKVNASNVQNQNANVDEKSFGGRFGETASSILRMYALNELVSDRSRENHINNMVYIHDLDHYALGDHNCLSVPIDKLLANGFNTRQTDVRPAQSINTAFQLVAVLFQVQSLQQFGGVSATHIDWSMAPYVKKSFMKHYIVAYLKDNKEFLELDLMDMFSDTYTDDVGITRDRFDDWVDEHKGGFFDKTGLSESDFYIGSKVLNKKYAQSALYDTILETQQAAEGMYHNLNIWAA